MENIAEKSDLLLEQLKDALEKEDDIIFAYLFGSYAHGIVHLESDIDIAFYLKSSEIKECLKREKEILSILIDRIHTDRIDLKILNTSTLIFQYYVLKEGILILVMDPQKRVDFETNVMERFFELKPYLDEYREMLLRRIKDDQSAG